MNVELTIPQQVLLERLLNEIERVVETRDVRESHSGVRSFVHGVFSMSPPEGFDFWQLKRKVLGARVRAVRA